MYLNFSSYKIKKSANLCAHGWFLFGSCNSKFITQSHNFTLSSGLQLLMCEQYLIYRVFFICLFIIVAIQNFPLQARMVLSLMPSNRNLNMAFALLLAVARHKHEIAIVLLWLQTVLTAFQCGETPRWTHGHTTWLLSFQYRRKVRHKSFTFFRTHLTSHIIHHSLIMSSVNSVYIQICYLNYRDLR
jgi:hypothetical protein